MKKCPFCKSEIEASAIRCLICKRTLIEKVPSSQPALGQAHVPLPGATAENKSVKPISKKRILGSVLFGLLVAGYLTNAFNYNIPFIISNIDHISLYAARKSYQNSNILNLIINTTCMLFAAGVAAFLAKRKGVLVGILTNSLFMAGYLYLLINFLLTQNIGSFVGMISYTSFLCISLLLVILASVLGGYYGQKFYSENKDSDIRNDKLTIFGIRWGHYFWIMPLIIYPFFSSFLMIFYSYVTLILGLFYILVHPSLWLHGFSFLSLILFFIMNGALWGTAYAFARFWELMRYKQALEKGWGKAVKVIGFGVLIPATTFSISELVARAMYYNLPIGFSSFTETSWKIGSYLFLGFFAIFGLISAYFWIKKSSSENNASDFPNGWGDFLDSMDETHVNVLTIVNEFIIPDQLDKRKFMANYQIISCESKEIYQQRAALLGEPDYSQYYSQYATASIDILCDPMSQPLGYERWFIAGYPDVVNWLSGISDEEITTILDSPSETNLFNDDHKFKFEYLRKMINAFKGKGNEFECSSK